MRLDLFFRLPIEIQIHLASTSICLVLGAYLMWGKKGVRTHRILGWFWVVLMAIAAASAAFIHGLKWIGPFSPIHIFVPITFWGLYEGVTYARAKKRNAHRNSMRSLYWAALCIPFAFALAPSRFLTHMLGIKDLGWIMTTLIALTLLTVGIYYRWEKFWLGLFRSWQKRKNPV